jgi:putative spermidine/putrescine transport system substrate-binding protein
MTDMAKDAGTTRRDFLRSAAYAAGALAAGPALAACGDIGASGAGSSSGKELVVRISGGSYQDANQKAIFDPFTSETGIKVSVVNHSESQMVAAFKQNNVQVDVTDSSGASLMTMEHKGALAKLDYGRIGRSFKLSDVPKSLVTDYMIGKTYWATVLAYRTDVFKGPAVPRSWADFWDVDRFPGPRSLQGSAAGLPGLEFAELAAGVPLDPARLYPIDVPAALRKMSAIRPHIVKFWDSGALSAELLDRKEVVMTSIWNGRAQTLIDAGRPVALGWGGARREVQYWAVLNGAPHKEAAFQFIDFAMQPKVQAALSRYISYGPTNRAGQPLVRAEDAAKLPTAPDQFPLGFDMNVSWWLSNQDVVIKQWDAWAQS